MSKFIYMFIALISIILMSANANAVALRGMPSCGDWVKNKGTDNWLFRTHQSWLIGYLSGIASGTGADILNGVDNNSIELWVTNYCNANPLSELNHAGDELYFYIVKQKNLR